MKRIYAALAVLGLVLVAPLHAQLWTNQIDPSRAISWQSNTGFSIPTYTVACATQPSLATGSGNASANTTAIQSALNSCDSSHNVVNLPSGTYYVAGITFGTQGFEVLRGAGANQTHLILTAEASCAGLSHGVCMLAANWTYSGAGNVAPPSGSNQCTWSSGYSQGSTTLGFTACGGTPPNGNTIILDQANDTSDTSGVYMCDGSTSNCTYEATRNADGRVISGNLYSETQTVLITGVTSLGGGAYTVTISPGVYSTNIRSGNTPGAWWPGFIQNTGIENLTLDGTELTDDGGGLLGFFSCYQCWAKGVAFLDAWRNAAWIFQSKNVIVRDSYFFGAQSHASTSYNIESDLSSDFLVENNIMQQTTTPLNMNGSSNGAVVDYNFAIDQIFSDGTWNWPIYASHATANNFNLYEGNIANGITMDNASGPSDQNTMFRNLLTGYQPTSNYAVTFTNGSASIAGPNGFESGQQVSFISAGGTLPTGLTAGTTYYVSASGLSGTAFEVSATNGGSVITMGSAGSGSPYVRVPVVGVTIPILFRANVRNNNVVGNVLGTSGFASTYQGYATSTTAFTNANYPESGLIYSLGGGGTGAVCALTPGQSTLCDTLTYSSLMRWGNYDTVNAAIRWNTTEGCPASNTYVNANCTNFVTPSETLPSSFLYSSTPSWWPSGKAFPIIGPDISTGNMGTCSGGTYAGWLATSSGQCTGGTFSTAWASHAISNPAMDCYLTTMAGPPNGSGSALSFNAATCYSGSSSPSPAAPQLFFTLQ